MGIAETNKANGLTFRGNVPLPRCGQTTKAGHPCPTVCPKVTLRGKKYQLKTCIPHAGQAIQKELNFGQGGPTPGCGQKKRPNPHTILRERVEADVDRYLKPLEDALVAMKAVVVGNGGSAHVQMVEDLGLRIKAVNDILDRVYGRPKQVTELTGTDGAPLEVLVPNDDERRQALAAVLASTGALGAPLIPANASASAPTTN